MCRLLGDKGRFREEHQTELANHDFIAVFKHRLINALAVHIGAIEASGIDNGILAIDPAKHGVLPGYGGIVQQNIRSGIATNSDFILIKPLPWSR